MRSLKYAVAFSAAGLVLIGCGNTPTGQSAEDPDYFPMNEGDFWEYSYSATRVSPDTVVWEEGSRLSRVLWVSGDTCRVENVKTLWILFGQQMPDTSVTRDTLTYLVTPDAIQIIASEEIFSKILDLPLYPGKTWSDTQNDWKVESTSEEISTPAGTFTDCAIISTPSEIYNTDIYFVYCPGIGDVSSYALGIQYMGSDIVSNVVFTLTNSSYLN